MAGSRLMWVKSPEIASLAQPGQFVMVRCGEGLDPLLRRPLSVHGVGAEGRLAFLFKVVGRGTQWLSGRREGNAIDILGPLGSGFYIAPGSRKLLLLAGGIGLAPLTFLAQQALTRGCSTVMLIGAKTKAMLYPTDLLPPQLELVITTEDGTSGRKGLATDALPELVEWLDQIFACGPLAMYRHLARQPILEQKAVQVSLELRMGCGMGGCFGCTMKTKQGLKQACREGPVLDLKEILWETVRV